ncbi:MAG: putative rane protein [Phycisphaerales bacterium]|nr:putative rane protein [Phycisphaerales bacterium]
MSRSSDSSSSGHTARDLGLFLIRAMVGTVFVFHGAQKLFGVWGGYGLKGTAGFFEKVNIPLPYPSAVAASVTEFFGAILLVLGLAFRPAAAVMAFTMAVAVWVHSPNGFPAPAGFEYPLTLGVVLLGLALIGPGRWAMGQMFAGKRRRPE